MPDHIIVPRLVFLWACVCQCVTLRWGSVNGEPSRVTNGSTNGIHPSASQDSVAIETVPPPRALEVVAALNAAHDEACEKYTERFINRCSA